MAAEQPIWERVERENRETEAVLLDHQGAEATFQADEVELVEIAIHEDVPRIYVINTGDLDQTSHWWMVVQPEVLQSDLRRGWAIVENDSVQYLGSEEGKAFQLRDGDPPTLCKVRSLGEAGFSIENWTERPLKLIVTRC